MVQHKKTNSYTMGQAAMARRFPRLAYKLTATKLHIYVHPELAPRYTLERVDGTYRLDTAHILRSFDSVHDVCAWVNPRI